MEKGTISMHQRLGSYVLFLIVAHVSWISCAFGQSATEWESMSADCAQMRTDLSELRKKWKAMESRVVAVNTQWHNVSKCWWAYQVETSVEGLENKCQEIEVFRKKEVRPLEKQIEDAEIELEKKRQAIERNLQPGTIEYEDALSILVLEYRRDLISIFEMDLKPAYTKYLESMEVYVSAMEKAVCVAILEPGCTDVAIKDLAKNFSGAIEEISALLIKLG